MLALPEKDSPVLTRELLYTGLSRARRGVVLVAGEGTLERTVNRRIERVSGLHAALERPTRNIPGAGAHGDANGEAGQ